MSGQIPHRATLLSVSIGFPCVITTTEAHGFFTHDFVRLTNLNGAMPFPHGTDQLDGHRYRIIVTGDNTFTLQNPITYENIDSSNFPPYTEGGYANLIETEFFYHGDD